MPVLADDEETLSIDQIQEAFQAAYPSAGLSNLGGEAIRAVLAAVNVVEKSEGLFPGRWNDGLNLGAKTARFIGRVVPPVSYLVPNIVPDPSVILVVGDSVTRKSWATLDLAVAAAHTDRPWLGKFALNASYRSKVVYLDFEMGEDELDRRLMLLGDDGSVVRVSHPGPKLDDEALWRPGLEILQPTLVIVDGLSSGFPGIDEKDARFANPLRRAAAWASEHGCTFVFVHHSPKDTSHGNVVRGSGAVFAAADAVFAVEAMRGTQNRSRLRCLKMRRGKAPPTFGFELTDEAKLVAFDPTEAAKTAPAPATDEERVMAAITKSADGISATKLADSLSLRKEDVLEHAKVLIGAGRIEFRGKGAKSRLHVIRSVQNDAHLDRSDFGPIGGP